MPLDSDTYFAYDYDIGKQDLTIYGKRASNNQYITLSIPKSDKSITVNFDVIDKQVPKKENIYLSNTNPKLGSSFYISSLFLEPYEEDIVNDAYHISQVEDSIEGGIYYNALEKNGLYYSPFSETVFRGALDLSNHHYVADDSNIIIDEANDIVRIGESTSPGIHTITSSYGSSVSFVVSNEICAPISMSEITVESVKDLVCPGQLVSSYIGQTIKLSGNGLSEHALMVKSNDEGICHAQIKKSLKNGVFAFNNELFVRGNEAGNTSLDVYLVDNPSIKLNNHSIVCDTFSNQFNIDVDLLFDGVSYQKQELVNNRDYRLDIIIRHRDTGIEEHPEYVSLTLIANYYSLSNS